MDWSKMLDEDSVSPLNFEVSWMLAAPEVFVFKTKSVDIRGTNKLVCFIQSTAVVCKLLHGSRKPASTAFAVHLPLDVDLASFVHKICVAHRPWRSSRISSIVDLFSGLKVGKVRLVVNKAPLGAGLFGS
jgi:hypothetical protein